MSELLLKNYLDKKGIFFLCMFLCFLYSDKALSATKYMYVGETCQIETPSAVSDNGYIDNAAVIQSDSHISVDVSDILNVKVTVIDYFEYTATVTVRFVEKYTYNGRVNKIDHDVSLQIKAMYPTITMLDGKKTASVSVSVGGTAKLEYKVEPSGLLAPPMYFGFSPFDSSYHIEKVSEDYNQNTGIGYLKVKGLSAGSNMIIALPYGNQTLNLIWEVTVGNSNKIELIATPPGGEVVKGTVVYLSTPNVTGASIYYTLDGTYPTQEFDPLYTSSGITINEDCTLRAIAYKNGYNHSDVLEEKYTIKSSDIEPTSIDVSPSSKTINVGDTFYCDYTLTPSNATTTVTWYSDNDNIASVNSSGKVTGVSAGTTYINAKTANGKEDWCKVTVESNPIPPTDIDVSPSYKTIKVGDTFYCDYTLTPSNATTTVTWYSDNSSVASVNSSGKVTGVSAGTTYINAKTANGKEDWCKVTVESNPIPPTDIDVSPSYKTIKVGETFYCDYTLTPSNATTTVTWYSDNSSIASVNLSGKVTGVSVGTTYINAKTANGKEDWCKVTVESNGDIAINATNFPDVNFRNFLLNKSYGRDGVLTVKEINDIKELWVTSEGISNLKGIEFFTALESLNCYWNEITSLDVSGNTSLTYLDCFGNQLTTLNVSRNTALKKLSCEFNQLTSLDLSSNTALTSLYCYNNQLTSLDLSSNTALKYLECWDNQLTSLDISRNTALVELMCSGNQLASLDVSRNTALTSLSCSSNQLSSLDVSRNTALTRLECTENQLTSLDVSGNTPLESLICFRNHIKGKAMDELIDGLRQNKSDDFYLFWVVITSDNSEANVCTKKQVTVLKSKGWTPVGVDKDVYKDGSGFFDLLDYIYEGSDEPSGIVSSSSSNASIYSSEYDLQGHRLSMHKKKGIFIKGGKKVVFK